MRILWILLLLSSNCLSQNGILGKWTTIDDNSGEARSVVEIAERGSKVFGKVVRLFPAAGEDPDPICDQCPEEDVRHNKKIIGLEIIQDMKWAEKELTSGSILDPESGKIYQCKIWLEGVDLKVRGYWGPFFRTQTWKKVH
jgi:uncharacterized protein (DUF2147 family)